MIKTFKHKGLEKFFCNNHRSLLNPQHLDRINRLLDRLDAALLVQDLNLPGYGYINWQGTEKTFGVLKCPAIGESPFALTRDMLMMST
jgi:proteic killer suppression protein